MTRAEAIRYAGHARRLPKRYRSVELRPGVILHNVKGRYRLHDGGAAVRALAEQARAKRERQERRKELATRLLRSCLHDTDPADHDERAVLTAVLDALGDSDTDLCAVIRAALRSGRLGGADILEAAVQGFDGEAREAMEKGDYPTMNRMADNAAKVDRLSRELFARL
jgi:hypothetical protein